MIITLDKIAFTRSGDKGAHSNVGVIFKSAKIYKWAKSNIRINAIAPGVILTDRVRAMLPLNDPVRVKTPLGPSEPEDVAPLALYLASDESRQMTGMILPLDGGASAV